MSHEAMTLWSLVGIHLLWILAPLIPAVLIYWLFPSTTIAVNGPLAALSVKATGAFAGYLVVFAATYPLANRAEETVGSFQRPYWTINARIQLQEKDKKDIVAPALFDTLIVQTKPEPFYTAENYVHLLVPEGQGLPYIIFQIPNFGRRGFDLKEATERLSIDEYNKTITVNDPIVISRQSLAGANQPP
jgi:membrane protein implicated in regulation of membrane protease activity